MSLSKLAAECRVCPNVDICDHKRMEAIGFLPLPEQEILIDPITEITVNIDSNVFYEEVAHRIQIPKRFLRGNY